MRRKRLPLDFSPDPLQALAEASAPSSANVSVKVDEPDFFALVTRRRNPQLTKQTIDQFCRYVRRGAALDAVCDLLYVSNEQFYRWKRLGDRFDPETSPKAEAVYAYFVQELRRAMAHYRKGLARQLHSKDAGPGWYRYLGILERRDRRTWGKDDPAGGADEGVTADEKFL